MAEAIEISLTNRKGLSDITNQGGIADAKRDAFGKKSEPSKKRVRFFDHNVDSDSDFLDEKKRKRADNVEVTKKESNENENSEEYPDVEDFAVGNFDVEHFEKSSLSQFSGRRMTMQYLQTLQGASANEEADSEGDEEEDSENLDSPAPRNLLDLVLDEKLFEDLVLLEDSDFQKMNEKMNDENER